MEHAAVGPEQIGEGRRRQLLDKAFLTADFSNVTMLSDRDACMAAAGSFWGDWLPPENVEPPSTRAVIKELEYATRLGEVPLPYLWHAFQRLSGFRTSEEIAADRAVTGVRVATFVPELALIGVTSIIAQGSKTAAKLTEVAMSPVTHADDLVEAIALQARGKLSVEAGRLIRKSFGENFHQSNEQAPWLAVHMLLRIARIGGDASTNTVPFLRDVLARTFDGSSKRSVFRLSVDDIKHDSELAENKFLVMHPIEELLCALPHFGLYESVRLFSKIRFEQKKAYGEIQAKKASKNMPENVRPDKHVEAKRWKRDGEYGALVHNADLVAKTFNGLMEAKNPDHDQRVLIAQTLGALSELSGLPSGAHRKFGPDYNDPAIQRFLANVGDELAHQGFDPPPLGMLRLIADAYSSDARVHKRSPFRAIDSDIREGLWVDLQSEALRHFNLDPNMYWGGRNAALRQAVTEAYLYRRTRRSDAAGDDEAMALIRDRRARRFLKAIDVRGVPIAKMQIDIAHAQAVRYSKAARTARNLAGTTVNLARTAAETVFSEFPD